MKKFILFVAIAFVSATSVVVNAQIELRNPTQENKTILKNPTENKDFNTNAMPFDEKTQDGPRMNLNKFGGEQQRNLNIKQGNYNHYNKQQNNTTTSIVTDVDRSAVNRPQSPTLNNEQFNYNQNANRKVESASATSVNYNAPMQVKTPGTKATTAADDIVIETGDQQNINVNPNDGSSNTTTPTVPGGDATPGPIGDAIPVLVMLAALYALILRRKA